MLRAVSSGRGGGHVLESLDIGTAYINGATISKTFGLELSEDACEDDDLPSGEQDLLVKLSARFHGNTIKIAKHRLICIGLMKNLMRCARRR